MGFIWTLAHTVYVICLDNIHAFIWDYQWKLDHTSHVKVCAGYHTISSLSSLHRGISSLQGIPFC